jgi:valyl-tRNA synthetase
LLGAERRVAEESVARRAQQEAHLEAGIERLEKLLANGSFADRAPVEVVARERARLVELTAQLRQLRGE